MEEAFCGKNRCIERLNIIFASREKKIKTLEILRLMKKILCVLVWLTFSSSFLFAANFSKVVRSTEELSCCGDVPEDSIAEEAMTIDKKFLEKLGAVYRDTVECPESSTAGMSDWAYNRAKEQDSKSAYLSRKLLASQKESTVLADSSGSNSVQLRQALLRENQVWKTLLTSLRTFDNIAIEISIIENGYGTIFMVISAGLFQDLSYIRMACLKEDVVTFTSPDKEIVKADEGMSVDSLYYYMSLCRPYVTAEMLRESDLSPSSVSDLKRLNNSHTISTMKKRVEAWITARRNVSDLLNPSAKSQYDLHTNKVLHSLIYHYWGFGC